MASLAANVQEQDISNLTAPSHAGPVTGAERISYLDILRGFAVMAIFIVNIKGMAMPFAFYMNGSAWDSELEQHIAGIQKFLVDDKWRTNFTALYGAGLAMMWSRLEARGEGRGILWRRNTLLLAFGLMHLLLIWIGDILTSYALAGFLAVLFVRRSIKWLFISAAIMLVFGWLWTSLFAMGPVFDEELSAKLSGFMWDSTSEEVAKEIAAYQGGVGEQLMSRVSSAGEYMLMYFLLGGHWLVTLGLMVMGMALFRSGFYAGSLSRGTYLTFAIIGLGAAWALDAFQLREITSSGWSFETFSMMMPVATLDGWLGAFGYAALVGVLVRAGLSFRRVAAVGRMAFTNYIACSLIGTTFAGGHALGWYGEANLGQLMVIVGATFVAMLIWSPLWLHYFRFGPLEWVWRSLTYGRVQKFRR